jgi:hypothetical protein
MPQLTADQTTMVLLVITALSALAVAGLVLVIVASMGARRAMAEGLARAFEELANLRQALTDQGVLIEQLDSRARAQEIGASGDKAVDAAVRMARTGASSDQLAATSGLTRQEARLLARIHGSDITRA